MRTGAQSFQTYREAEEARERFPYCAVCGADLKIEWAGWLTCTRFTSHRGISDKRAALEVQG